MQLSPVGPWRLGGEGDIRDFFHQSIVFAIMKTEFFDVVSRYVSGDTAKQYADFCDWIRNKTEFNSQVTSQVFANINFKKQLAKEIVASLLVGHDDDILGCRLWRDSMDVRLRSLIKYYLSVEILGSPDLPEEIIRKTFSDYSRSKWIEGWSILDTSDEAIVKMRPQDSMYEGYRCFVVNMLCFTANQFVLGFRTDSGPVCSPMKYFKGCKPLGRKVANTGIEWNTIMFDRSLSDDHIAIFSNQLDGEGTIEICDWLSDSNQRVIFRADY